MHLVYFLLCYCMLNYYGLWRYKKSYSIIIMFIHLWRPLFSFYSTFGQRRNNVFVGHEYPVFSRGVLRGTQYKDRLANLHKTCKSHYWRRNEYLEGWPAKCGHLREFVTRFPSQRPPGGEPVSVQNDFPRGLLYFGVTCSWFGAAMLRSWLRCLNCLSVCSTAYAFPKST